MKYICSTQARAKYGYHPKTLARWADEKKVKYIRTPGGHRRYLINSLEGLAEPSSDKKVVLYCRVSTHSQKDDLETQSNELSQKVPNAEVIK